MAVKQSTSYKEELGSLLQLNLIYKASNMERVAAKWLELNIAGLECFVNTVIFISISHLTEVLV